MKNDENLGEYFQAVIRERQQEDAANELMQNANINFSPNAPKLDAVEIKPKKSLPVRIAKDVGYGVYESFGAVANGLSNAVQETLHAGEDIIEWVDNKVSKDLAEEGILDDGSYLFNWKKSPLGKRKTVTGEAIEAITSFVAGFIGAGKFIKPLRYVKDGKNNIAKAIARGSIADATVFDPQEERLSNLIESVPALQSPITDFLKADPNDNKAYGRFKAAIEGAVVGGAAEALPMIVRFMRGQAREQADDLLKFQKDKNQKLIDDDHLETNWADDLGPTTGPQSKKKIVGFNKFGREDGVKNQSFIEQEIKSDPLRKILHSLDNSVIPDINFNQMNTEQDVIDLVKEFSDSKEGKKILKQYKSDRKSIPMTKESKVYYESIKEEIGPARAKFYDETTHMKVEDASKITGTDIKTLLRKYQHPKSI